jgi:hypothetical protein
MKKYALFTIAILLPSFFLLGCASSEMVAKKSFEKKLNNYTTLYFSTESAVTEDVTEEIADFEEHFMSRIKEANLFKDSQLGKGENALEGSVKVKAVITDINKLGGVSRALFGAFAGKASMTVELTFIDSATGNIIGNYEITGKSGGSGVSGGTKDAVEKTAESVVELMTQNYQ